MIGETVRLWGTLDALERDHHLDFLRQPDLGFACGLPLGRGRRARRRPLMVSDLAAGDFVRWMKQLIDLAGQVADAAGATPLRETAREVVRRLPVACRLLLARRRRVAAATPRGRPARRPLNGLLTAFSTPGRRERRR